VTITYGAIQLTRP